MTHSSYAFNSDISYNSVQKTTKSDSDQHRLLYVTFHGGSDTQDVNTVYAYSMNTTKFMGDVLAENQGFLPPLLNLRGMYLDYVNDRLFVANSNKFNSAVYVFGPVVYGGVRRKYLSAFITDTVYPSIEHPYSLASGASYNPILYVSSQNAAAVFRFKGDLDGFPMGIPESLQPPNYPEGTFPPGFFVPNASMAHSSEEGLTNPRGISIGPDRKRVYVADEYCQCIKMFDINSGQYLGKLTYKHLKSPIQMIWNSAGTLMYITSKENNEVIVYSVQTGELSRLVRKNNNGGLNAPSGMVLDEENGWIYVASRKGKQILRYRLSDGSPDWKPFIDDLPDNPEFLMIYPK